MITWADLAGVSTPEVRAMLADAEQNGDDQVAEVCRGVIAFREPEERADMLLMGFVYRYSARKEA